ncbi:MAG: GGDEF domain-containing protein [Lachnospiraceae bacterium]|nr:GGDEF domain-containing protein [Lachnospiraceae bacterium]
MQEQNKRHNLFLIIYMFIIVLWLVSVLFKAGRFEGHQILIDKGQYYDCCEGWYDDEGNVFNIEKLVFTKEEVGKEKVVHYQIPDDCKLTGGEAICFFSRGMDFNVYATAPEGSPYYGSDEFGSRDIYEYRQNSANLSGKDIGLTVQVVPINIMDRYNEISISIIPAEYSAFILEMRIEKASQYIFSTVRSRMPRFMLSIFIIFFGLSTLVYTAFAVEKKREEKTVLYAWGWFTLITGTLLMIESQMIQILTGKPELMSSIKYALALLICFPGAVLCDSVTTYPHKRFSHKIGIIAAVLFAIEAVGAFFLNVSLYRLFLLSAILLVANNVITVYFICMEIKNRKTLHATKLSLFVNVMMFLYFVVFMVDIGSYAMASRHLTDWGRIMRVFYAGFLFVMLIYLLRLSVIWNHQAMLAQKYKIESRTDALTGLLNKGAYIEKEAELTGKLMGGREKGVDDFSFVIVSLDLNYLKKVNDNYGHEAGDRYIQSAANILKDAVGEKGETYRTGGDEFLAILYGENLEAVYDAMIEDLNSRIDAFNQKENKEIKLSFAYGHAICNSSQDYSIHDSERLADKEMYECKRRMKAERRGV